MSIPKKKDILIGTSGDYPPFSFIDPGSRQFRGMDIEAAENLGAFLGAKVKFVRFKWTDLINDLLTEQFDIAVGGISQSRSRGFSAAYSNTYMTISSGAIVRNGDEVKFPRFDAADKPGVRIILNQDGSNDRYFTARIKNAKIMRHNRNEEIALKVRDGHADVWITDNVEAFYWADKLTELTAISPENPIRTQAKVYLIRQNNPELLVLINRWIDRMFREGTFQALQEKWVGKFI